MLFKHKQINILEICCDVQTYVLFFQKRHFLLHVFFGIFDFLLLLCLVNLRHLVPIPFARALCKIGPISPDETNDFIAAIKDYYYFEMLYGTYVSNIMEQHFYFL
jgi:hypothetical protein